MTLSLASLNDRAFRQRLWFGACGWVVLAVVFVVVRGVRWEETYEHALIITGKVPYPGGHPSFRYARNVYSLQSYLSAALLWLTDSPTVVCGLRNVLQLVFSILPVYLLAAGLAGAARWGHVAAVFVLLGTHVVFQSYYPIVAWPHLYGIGQIGMGYALLVLFAFLAGYWRTAWFMAGLMVAVHIGQLPVVLAVGGIMGLRAVWKKDWSHVTQGALFAFLGLLPCLIFWIVLRVFFEVPSPETGPYAVTGDVHAIWAGYSQNYDLHRFFTRFNPFWHSAMAAGALLFLCGGAALVECRDSRERPHTWIFCYAAITAVVVYGIYGLQMILGTELPVGFILWMPYRLTNHLAALLIVTALALTVRPPGNHAFRSDATRWLPVALLAYAALLPVLQLVLPETIFNRYLGTTESMLFALVGSAAYVVMRALRGRGLVTAAWIIFGILGWVVLATAHQLAGASILLGFVAAALLSNGLPVPKRRAHHGALGTVCALVLLGLGAREFWHREHLPRTGLQETLTEYLERRGEENAMLVPPFWGIEWLSHTRHPIMADYQTAHHMTYMPSLAPPIHRLHADIYGWQVDQPAGWNLDAWAARDLAGWQKLGQAYDFHYVIAPAQLSLDLPAIMTNGQLNVYRIPSVTGNG